MPKEWNVCSLTILLLVTILVTTISSYFKISNIENYLTTPTATDTSNVIDLYQSETVKELRKKALISAENDRKVLYNASLKTNGQDFYRKVKMEAYCDQKERIGEKGDGGKYVCNPKKVKKDCTLMSLGLNNQIGYDKHIFEVTGGQCRILGADVDPQNQKTQDSYAKINGELFAGKIPTDLPIPRMLEKSGRKEVELLKIDIEKGEFTALEPSIRDYFVCQKYFEFIMVDQASIILLSLSVSTSLPELMLEFSMLLLYLPNFPENYLTTPTATDTSDVIDLYQSETVKELRKKALISAENDRRVLFNASLKTNGQDFYRKVKMEAYCGQKERIGEKGDGGKYVCNPKKIKKDCTLMSLGLNNQIGYDKHIFEVTGGQCRILGADVDPQNQKTQDSYAKINGELFAGKIPTDLPIPRMLEESGRKEVELLKIDIEKGEFTALEPLIRDYFVCQKYFEFIMVDQASIILLSLSVSTSLPELMLEFSMLLLYLPNFPENYLTTPTATDTSDVIDLYQSETVKELRKKALISAENDRRVLFNASLKTNGQDFYRKVKMEAYCGQKERIGEKGDGGKYVCNPKKIKKDCTLMSLGLNNQIGYDKHIFEVTGGQCRILGADVDPQNQKTQDSYAKINGELFAGKIPTDLPIPRMLEESGRKEVELLKIDIEKGEFTALEPLIRDYFVCQNCIVYVIPVV
ncbi:hypothetical protein GCK72_012507 [Caenorhabditis remanei]|uniref:Methyltransferase FkbM domain-containing protein n=1 Tax=Caenorhabditis remanei TaxID=31234 RepID=A0A6A5GN22_CAERE|nr:hypothetical protein GCK72_012507 [Caenorhabditis remanei]KAF1756054.1 hypothetical protein GCK72_012507 [Caenorhabditis remanei]